MIKVITGVMTATVLGGILFYGEPSTKATDGFGYPPPPTAGPTRAPAYAGQSASAVANEILSTLKQKGHASTDTVVVAVSDVTSADAVCFGYRASLMAAGDPTDVAVLLSGSAIKSPMPGSSGTSSPYMLFTVDRKTGIMYGVEKAPTLALLQTQIDCAAQH